MSDTSKAIDPAVASTSTATPSIHAVIPTADPNAADTNWDRSASTTVMETIRVSHKWRIEEFSTQQELSNSGDYVESIIFPTSDADERYRFRLRLFPNGKDDDCRGYLSLFLQIQRCPGARLRFRVNFYIQTTEGQRGCALNRNIVSINKGGIVTASKFFSAETLKSRATRFVPGDVLTVGVDLTVFGEQSCSQLAVLPPVVRDADLDVGSVFPVVEHKKGSLPDDMRLLFERMTTPNMTIRIGGATLACHKATLMARSSYFNAMFGHEGNSEYGKHEIEMHDVSEVGMRAALQFMYTDRVDDVGAVAQETLAVADMLNIDLLKEQCEQALILLHRKEGTPEDACQLLHVADTYSAMLLKEHCLGVLLAHDARVMISGEWIQLQCDHPALAAETLRDILMRRRARHDDGGSGVVPQFDTTTAKAGGGASAGEPAAKRSRHE